MQTRNGLLIIALLSIIGCRSVGQSPLRANAPDIRRIHPADGTHLIRFQQLDEGVYKGSKPKTDADYRFLQSKGVKYIVNLKFFPWINNWEKHKARKYGMTLLTGTISASPMTPSESHMNAVLCLMRDKRYHPIYIHCDLGRDRAMLIAGLYEMYYHGKSKQEAYKEMKYYGFKDDWTLAGLKNYFEKHSAQPVTQYVPHCPERPIQAPGLHKKTNGPQQVDSDTSSDVLEPCE
jgi:DSP-PTPase phosphatase fused to NAD+ Kinase